MVSISPEALAQSPAPSSTKPQPNKQLDDLLKAARERVDAKDFNGAIALYQQALRLDDRNARLYSGIGYLQAQQGNYSASLESYRLASRLEPRNADFIYAQGFCLGNLNQDSEAIAPTAKRPPSTRAISMPSKALGSCYRVNRTTTAP
ncbi:MAG: tetratricopeptide repeat protein [Alkalinema sp. RU_4_3]|nr:tetratricopeptide repeat protein [Alkalinema sp. RU_4_3]